MGDTVIAARPPDDGREWDCQCARCGSSVVYDDCYHCGGGGVVSPDDWDAEDGWDGEEDEENCTECGGLGGFPCCISDADWCEARPRPGREQTERGKVEWYVVERGGDHG